MKQDQRGFSAYASRVAGAYQGDVADRVRRFLPMVRRLAWHIHGSGRPGIELEDLIQAGLVALTECAQKHQGPTEDGFAAYAKMRVRGAMVDLIRRTVPMSRGASERRRQLAGKETELRGILGRDPLPHELAGAMGIEEAELAALRGSSQPLHFESIDEVYSDQNMAFADERPDSLALLADEELRGAVVEAIADLPDRLQLVVQLYFVEELNLAEIAQVLQVSIPRVHQLKAQALAKLRGSLEGVADIL
ncbi:MULTISPECIES: sigma-70 family RNA polymerase sigma factor [Novosphingobium]|uniref:sigma-70 family RNA polymerase sigma factor n=1 Tax=unclassified Novosphingobium TaxID=2644732 RepID=UPI0006C8856C|nr:MULTISPECIES: sigma-70 family RNA polymerase sigma factor [unclassified Novosphingobium]KPH65763.1 RNA polymerase subunit sigma [Novosphingobium sp. ST904]MPS70313.1 sigma-70 family RNA polymerase sigma factor [Novosphingobium sp.]TCM37342.1 RNA polymerase sigma factor for flagellar operon FliA [Novosphingobium sp. ST904]